MNMLGHAVRGRSCIGGIALWTGAALVVFCAHVGAVAWAMREPPMVKADSPPPVDLVRRASPVPTPPPGVHKTVIAPDRFSVR